MRSSLTAFLLTLFALKNIIFAVEISAMQSKSSAILTRRSVHVGHRWYRAFQHSRDRHKAEPRFLLRCGRLQASVLDPEGAHVVHRCRRYLPDPGETV